MVARELGGLGDPVQRDPVGVVLHDVGHIEHRRAHGRLRPHPGSTDVDPDAVLAQHRSRAPCPAC